MLVSASVSGSALWRACGLRAAPSAAPAAGLAIVLFLAAIGIRLPGRAKMAAALVGLALLVAIVALWRMKRGPRLGMPLWAWITAAAVLAIALIPFGASGRAGILGVGTNDDMSEHLLAAWAMQGPHADVLSKLVHSGYPIAPHALVAAIASVTGISLEHAFMGMLVAVPALLALAAAGLISVLCERLGEPFPPPRPLALALAGGLAGVCYLQSAFLAQASFKEPLESMFVLAFAAALLSGRDVTGWTARRHTHVIGIPAAVLASGSVYVYSYPGLAWIGGTLVIWTVVLIASRQWRAPRDWRVPAVAIVVFGVLIAPEIPRLIAFAGSGYNRETAHVFGNLPRALPPREVLGIWPRLDFRFDVAVGSPAGIAGLVAFAALLLCLIRLVVRREAMLPIVFGLAATLYGVNALRSPYSAAKTMTILAPVVTVILAREALRLLAERPRPVSARTGAIAALTVLLGWGAYSDLEVLRDAPVGPQAHADELSGLRARIGSVPTLFLGADDFIHWELRGANIATPPAPLYTTTVVPLRLSKAHQDPRLRALRGPHTTLNRFAGVGLAFDFDSIPASVLNHFTYAILPRSGYRSTPPSNWHRVTAGRSYELWRRIGPTPVRQTLTEVDNPGAILDCRSAALRLISEQRGTAMVRARPVVGGRTAWHGRIGYAGVGRQPDTPARPGAVADRPAIRRNRPDHGHRTGTPGHVAGHGRAARPVLARRHGHHQAPAPDADHRARGPAALARPGPRGVRADPGPDPDGAGRARSHHGLPRARR